VVLECVPSEVAQIITVALAIPVIGIGAGHHTDGQVLVFHDLLGLNPGFSPRFVRAFADAGSAVASGLNAYSAAVADGSFPSQKESY
jgi:3-methyl-2-oxobutanoate hydroxymethyltransferase